ncbi:MAG: DNRLRE domain-containing protein [Planctomycetota bacterium]
MKHLAQLVIAACLTGAQVPADVLTLGADRDNTLYESETGDKSNGAGRYLFAGVTEMAATRRGVIRFNVAGALPAGSTVTSVELRLHLSKSSGAGAKVVRLHRALAAWGEGASDAWAEEGAGADSEPGDATWIHRFYPDDLWASAGGDFQATTSAVLSVGGLGPKVWGPTGAMVADVQAWLDNPGDNHGWVLVGDETGGASARRFNTRENKEAATRPELTIVFDPAPCPPQVGAAEVVRLGAPANPDAFRPGLTSGPVVGAVWDPYLDHAAFQPAAVLDFVGFGALATDVPSPFGTLLCGASPTVVLTAPAGAAFAVPIENSCYLVGVSLCAQGGSVDALGNIALANALDLTLGAF